MDVALALENGLERYAKPLFKMRALEVYRDTASQALTPDLLAAVHRAMDQSEYFILLASPESAQSPWVPKELTHWCENHGVEKFIVVLCAGQIVWNDETGDFDWDKTDALPASLSGYFKGCPLYLDLTWARGRTDLNQHNPQFKKAISQLSATLHGKSIDDMYSEEARQFRRTRRIKNMAIGSLASLFVIAGIAALMALIARGEALYQMDVAIKRNLVNEIRQQLNNNQFIKALQIARATRETFGDDPGANKVVWQLVSHPTTVLAQWQDVSANAAELSDNHEWLMIWAENTDETSDVTIRNWQSGKEVRRGGVLNAWFIDNNRHLLEVMPYYSNKVWSHNQSTCELGRLVYFDGEWQRMHAYSSIVDLDSGKYLAWPGEPVLANIHAGSYEGKVHPGWSGLSAEVCGTQLQLFSAEGEYEGGFAVPGAEWVESGKDGQALAVTTESGVQLYDRAGQLIAPVIGYDPVFSQDGRFMATVVYDNFPFDFETYAMGVVHPAIDEKLAYHIGQLVAIEQDANEEADDEEEIDYTGRGFTVVWNADGSEHMRLPGTDPVFTTDGVFTMGGFDFEGFMDDDLRLWGLEPILDGGPYDALGGRAPFMMGLEGDYPKLSADGQWLTTEVDGGTNIYTGEGQFIHHLAGTNPSFVGDLPILITQAESWTRLWYLPRMATDISAYFKADPESEFAIDHCLGVAYGQQPEPGYDVGYPDEFYLAICDSMPPTTPWLAGTRMELDVTRPTGNDRSETVTVEVSGCNVIMERFHNSLYLQSCGEGFWRLFNLDTLQAGQPEENLYQQHNLWKRLKGAVFSPDGRQIAAVSSYGVVRIWEVEEILSDPEAGFYEFDIASDPHTLLFSPDSQWLLTATDNSPIKLWNLEGDELSRFPPPELGEAITDVVFSDDGDTLHVRLKQEDGAVSYWNRTVDFDKLLAEFDWVPDLSPDDRERLGFD